MTRAAELRRLDHLGTGAFDRLSHDHLSDLRRTVAAHDLGAEREHLIPVSHHSSAIDRSKVGDTVDGVPERVHPAAVRVRGGAVLHQRSKRGERRHEGVQDRLHHRFPP